MSDITAVVIALAYIPKVSGMISITSSIYIIKDLMRNGYQNVTHTRDIMLMMMSVVDILSAFTSFFLGSWPAPKGMGYYGAVGNISTCDAQGYIGNLLGGIRIAYNSLLAMMFLSVVRYHCVEARLTKMMPYFIYTPIAILAIILMPVLIKGGFNFNGRSTCSIAPSPLNCQTDPTIECERGESMFVYGEMVQLSAMVIGNICLTYAMVMLYWTVLQIERQMDRYDIEGCTNRRHSKQVGVQGIFYVVAFYLTYLPMLIGVLLSIMGKHDPVWLSLTVATIQPLQGFYNVVVYLRPRYLKNSKCHPEQNFCNIICMTVNHVTQESTAAKNRESTAAKNRESTAAENMESAAAKNNNRADG